MLGIIFSKTFKYKCINCVMLNLNIIGVYYTVILLYITYFALGVFHLSIVINKGCISESDYSYKSCLFLTCFQLNKNE